MMNGNLNDMMKAMQAWNTFKDNHPKFPAFMNAVKKEGIHEGTVVELAFTTPEGKKIETSLRVTESDLQLFEMMKELR